MTRGVSGTSGGFPAVACSAVRGIDPPGQMTREQGIAPVPFGWSDSCPKRRRSVHSPVAPHLMPGVASGCREQDQEDAAAQVARRCRHRRHLGRLGRRPRPEDALGLPPRQERPCITATGQVEADPRRADVSVVGTPAGPGASRIRPCPFRPVVPAVRPHLGRAGARAPAAGGPGPEHCCRDGLPGRIEFLSQVHDQLNQPHGAGPSGSRCSRQLAAISASAETKLAGIDTGPSQALVAPLASKRNEFVTQLDDARSRLTKAAAVSAVVATILQGPQAYVVLAANNAEMRAGSGAFLDVGMATTADGSVHLGDLSPSGERPFRTVRSTRPVISSATGVGSIRVGTCGTWG